MTPPKEPYIRDFETVTDRPAANGLSLHAFSLAQSPNSGLHLDMDAGRIFWLELPQEKTQSDWLDIFSLKGGAFNGAFSLLGQRITPALPLSALLKLKAQLQTVLPCPAFMENWTFEAQLALILRLKKIPPKEIARRCDQAILWAELQHMRHKPICSLSAFERLQLSWLCALVSNPRFLLIHAQTMPYADSFGAKITATLENIILHGHLVLILATPMDRMIYQFWQQRLSELQFYRLPD